MPQKICLLHFLDVMVNIWRSETLDLINKAIANGKQQCKQLSLFFLDYLLKTLYDLCQNTDDFLMPAVFFFVCFRVTWTRSA